MAHTNIAASEDAFIKIFEAVRNHFKFLKTDNGSFGPFRAGYDVALHLEGGSVDLRADNTISVKELDIIWDKLDLSIGFDIPEICVGGFCILPTPWGCAIHAPRICVFEDDPDVEITLHLGEFVRSEISLVASLIAKYHVDPNRQPWMDDWDAAEQTPSVANRWQIYLDPQTVDLDLFDIADMVGDLLERAVEAVVDGLLGWLPGWAKDIIKAILGPIIDLIRAILDIPDDIQEWISDLLNISFGLSDLILTFVAQYFAAKYPIAEFDDPHTVLDKAENPNGPTLPALVPVKIPLKNLTVFNDDTEIVVQADIG